MNILDNLKEKFNEPLQITAWETTIDNLHQILQTAARLNQDLHNWGLIFEYELPMDLIRPDLILINSKNVYIIEIKNKNNYSQTDFEQTKNYLRNIQNYHNKSQFMSCIGLLWVMKSQLKNLHKFNIDIINNQGLLEILTQDNNAGISETYLTNWIKSAYTPLPNIIEAIKKVFQNEELPNIKTAQSAGTKDTVDYLNEISVRSKMDKKHALVLLTGVPGSGKTLVGLQFVHEKATTEELAIYITGNGPLERVIVDYLGKDGQTLVKQILPIKKQYLRNELDLGNHRILVFDEAQRVWDEKQVQKAQGILRTEGDILVDIVSKFPDWGVLICLIGEGQTIHTGETSDLEVWIKAIINYPSDWTIFIPDKYQHLFSRLGNKARIEINSKLNLSLSLRAHSAAEYYNNFIESLLTGNLTESAKQAEKTKNNHFFMYITSNLEIAKQFLKEFFKNYKKIKTYGIIASSRANNLIQYNIDVRNYTGPSGYTTRFFKFKDVPRYFNYKPQLKDNSMFCTSFQKVVREFDSQGLELDSAILAWGNDLIFDNTWIPNTTRMSGSNKVERVFNIYRVLLSRARDGIVIFCPKDETYGKTYETLKQAGFDELK